MQSRQSRSQQNKVNVKGKLMKVTRIYSDGAFDAQ